MTAPPTGSRIWPISAPVVQPETALEPLLLDPSGPAVVAIGGGHGLAAALEAIQLYAGSITAIVSVADDGGSSGRLTEAMEMPAPGDIRRCLLALTPEPSLTSELFAFRFASGDVSDHSLGNLMLAGLTELFGDFESAVAAAGRMLGTLGAVVPATVEPISLLAEIGGAEVAGQAAISKTRGGVEGIRLEPQDVVPSRAAIDAIAQADQIVIGPGSLFTSVIACLLVPGIAEAVVASQAQRVFVCNLVTQDGETYGLDGPGHVAALEEFGGVSGPGVVVVHEGELVVPDGLDPIAFDGPHAGQWRIERASVVDPLADWPAHEPMALAHVLEALLG